MLLLTYSAYGMMQYSSCSMSQSDCDMARPGMSCTATATEHNQRFVPVHTAGCSGYSTTSACLSARLTAVMMLLLLPAATAVLVGFCRVGHTQ